MSVEIVRPDSTELKDLVLKQIGTKWIFTIDDREIIPLFRTIATIKYLPVKYDKITISLEMSVLEYMELIQNKIKELVPDLTHFIKGDSMPLKLSTSIKKELKNSSINDRISVIIQFNGVYNLNGKKYASFSLEQFKKCASVDYL